MKILDLDLNISYMKDNLVELQKASQRIDKSNFSIKSTTLDEIPYESQENAVIVSYVKDKTNISEIFKVFFDFQISTSFIESSTMLQRSTKITMKYSRKIATAQTPYGSIRPLITSHLLFSANDSTRT